MESNSKTQSDRTSQASPAAAPAANNAPVSMGKGRDTDLRPAKSDAAARPSSTGAIGSPSDMSGEHAGEKSNPAGASCDKGAPKADDAACCQSSKAGETALEGDSDQEANSNGNKSARPAVIVPAKASTVAGR